MEYIEIVEHAGKLLAALVTIAGLVFSKKLWGRTVAAGRAIASFGSGIAHLSELVETVRRIERQFLPNGGKSLHDIVHMIRAELALVQGDVTKVTGVLRISWDSLGSMGMFYADPQGAFTYASTVMCRWLRRGEAQLLGRGWLSAVVADFREEVATEWASCISDRRDFLMRFAVTDSEGAVFEVIATAAPVTSSGSTAPVMWVGTVRKVLAHEASLHRISMDEE